MELLAPGAGKKGVINALLVLALAGCGGKAELAQAEAPQFPAGADVSALDDTLQQAVNKRTLKGVSLLLMQNGEVVFKEGYGNLSVDDRIKVASSTKPVATVGILILVDEGKLSLDDTIGSLLPEFQGTPVEKATLGQLLSHQAGIGGDYPGGRPSRGSLADFSRLIAKKGDLSRPGEFNYSGVSMDIACRMAEIAAGIPIEEHLKSRVFVPLDMTHSDFAIAADPGSVSSAQKANGEGRYVSCGGGMESTLDDMANFYEMLLQSGVYRDQRLISEQMYTDMISKHGVNPRKLNDPYTTGEYGYGIYRDRVAADGTPLTISHGGALGTMPWVDLDTGLVGVFFSQSRLRKLFPLIAEVQAEARAQTFTNTATPASPGTGQSPGEPSPNGSGGQRAPNRVFDRVSGGAEVINLKQFQEFIETQTSNSRLKGKPEFVEVLFKRLDANSDGVLTLEEYSEMQNLKRQ